MKGEGGRKTDTEGKERERGREGGRENERGERGVGDGEREIERLIPYFVHLSRRLYY